VYINSPTGTNLIKDGSFEKWNQTWTLYWKRNSQVVAADGTSLPAKYRVILTASSSDDTHKGGMWSGLINLSSLNGKWWTGRGNYMAGSASKIYQTFKFIPPTAKQSIAVNEIMSPQIHLFPNPLGKGQQLTIRTSGFSERELDIVVYDTKGSICMQRKIACNADIGLKNDLSAGVYFIHFMTKSKMLVRKLIVE
jgi:hypothetical protein